MTNKTSARIRQDFLDFFKQKGHVIVSSSPVVPTDDPTLLFTNAGMNQFKPIFLGDEDSLFVDGASWLRAANTQKCIRVSGKHNDLEEVGHDTYHHTLFEMLGNWSFGDYFKKEAIAWAWELLVDKWGLDPSRLYATVFGGDEQDGLPVDQEAIELWKTETTISHDHILACGKKDNFWEMGETGPCGPCSEIHIDLRPDEERKKQPGAELVNQDDPRVMEIWNLVFIQFNRLKSGELQSLPAKHVDTGMGFERICAVLQSKSSNYDSDVFTPLIDAISDRAGVRYGDDNYVDIAVRVIADHIRAVAFSIADGASPGNDGRGYVVRRILRRAIRYAWDRLHIKEPFLFDLVGVLGEQFKEVFPELMAQQAYVEKVIQSEEKSFIRTLGQGIELFHEMTKNVETLSGENAFKLHDTYGFPIDLTQLMAREKGLDVDEDGFEALMKEQKERARAAGSFSVDHGDKQEWVWVKGAASTSEFIGYDQLESEAQILAYREDQEGVQVLLNKTPFYAESGGQVSDRGVLIQDDVEFEVKGVQKIPQGSVHSLDQLPELNKPIVAQVDSSTRAATCSNHTATHLLQAALSQVLGSHVAQKGSLVNDHHLRFDFTHFEAMSPEEIQQVERMVNEKIRQNIALDELRDCPIDDAKKLGARMLFGEKYGERVRVVSFDRSFSMELCGGTHVSNTGKIGFFKIVHESSVAAGIRRIEALTGIAAEEWVDQQQKLVEQVESVLGQGDHIVEHLERLQKEKKQLEKQLEHMIALQADRELDRLIASAETLENGVKWVFGALNEYQIDTLKDMGYKILNKLPYRTVTTLFSHDSSTDKVYIMAAVSPDLIAKGLKAGSLVGQLGKVVGGGGGGQPSLATAGGSKPEEIQHALGVAKQVIEDYS